MTDNKTVAKDTALDASKTALIPVGVGMLMAQDLNTKIIGCFVIGCGVVLNYLKYRGR